MPQLHVLHVTLSRSRGIILIIIESESYLLFGNHETWSRLSEWKIVLMCQGCACHELRDICIYLNIVLAKTINISVHFKNRDNDIVVS